MAGFGVVVDFPVQHNPKPAILVGDRLVAARQINDAEPSESEANALTAIDTLVVRPTMNNGFVHLMDDFLRERLAALVLEDAANSAHGRYPSLQPRPGGEKRDRGKNFGTYQACGSS